jgi:hypothetical protein
MVVSTSGSTWLPLVLGAGLLLLILVTGTRRNVLAYVGLYFFVFAFGPVINHVTGARIYFGTTVEQIPKAAMGFALALLGMLLAAFVIRQRDDFAETPAEPEKRTYPLVPVVLWTLTAYSAAIVLFRGPAMLGANKLIQVALAGPFHYEYLLVQLCACSLYFLAWRSPAGRVAFVANFLGYLVYSLTTSERDFIFVLFSLVLHHQLLRPVRLRRLALMGAALLWVASALFALRSGGGGVRTADVLNQGSLLFVDTFVMQLVPGSMPLLYGHSYLDAVTGLLPFGLGGVSISLTQWLVNTYAPGSSSGFGFSLTAEAYLNFGLLGIPVVFAVLTATHRWLVNRIDTGHVFAYTSVLYTTAWMYAFRGESATFVKTVAAGLLMYLVIHLCSMRVREKGDDRAARRRAGAPVPPDTGRSSVDAGGVP